MACVRDAGIKYDAPKAQVPEPHTQRLVSTIKMEFSRDRGRISLRNLHHS